MYDVSKLPFWDKFRAPLNPKEILTSATLHVNTSWVRFLVLLPLPLELSAAGAATRRSATTHLSSRPCHLSAALCLYCWFCESRAYQVYLNLNFRLLELLSWGKHEVSISITWNSIYPSHPIQIFRLSKYRPYTQISISKFINFIIIIWPTILKYCNTN